MPWKCRSANASLARGHAEFAPGPDAATGYNGESSRTNKFDYRLQIMGPDTTGISGTASIASKWWQ
jgi:hypothetical protein